RALPMRGPPPRRAPYQGQLGRRSGQADRVVAELLQVQADPDRVGVAADPVGRRLVGEDLRRHLDLFDLGPVVAGWTDLRGDVVVEDRELQVAGSEHVAAGPVGAVLSYRQAGQGVR